MTRTFTSKLTLIAFSAVLVSTSWSCNSRKRVEKAEFAALRTQLLRISKTPTEKLGPEVERLEDLDLKTPRIDACRDACSEAYALIVRASMRSREAQEIIASLEEVTGEGEAISSDLAEKQEKALALLDASEDDLDDARDRKESCHSLLAALESEGLDRDR